LEGGIGRVSVIISRHEDIQQVRQGGRVSGVHFLVMQHFPLKKLHLLSDRAH